MLKDKRIILVLILGLVTVIFLGLSFAYFSAGIFGSEDASTIVVGGGVMRIVYEDSDPSITINGAYPSDTEWATKDFTVTGTNTTGLKMKYKVNLVIDNNELSEGALTYKLTGQGKKTIGSHGIVDTSGVTEIGSGFFYPGVDIVHTYRLKIYFLDNGEDQSIDQDKSFSSHIEIVEDGSEKIDPNAVEKGSIITMNVGEGLPNVYKVINVVGSEAEVIAISGYDWSNFNDESVIDEINGIEYQKYDGSNVDVLLNEYFYNEMSSTAKNALIPKEIYQNIYSIQDAEPLNPNDLNSMENDYDYAFCFRDENKNYCIPINFEASVSIEERYIYNLGLDDIYDSIEENIIYIEELKEILPIDLTESVGTFLKSNFRGINDELVGIYYDFQEDIISITPIPADIETMIFPVFTIDLSKISYSVNQTKTVTFLANGGSGSQESFSTDLGGDYELPITTFNAPAGKAFKGWSLSNDGEIIKRVDMSEDNELYAIWGEPEKGDLITLNVGDNLPSIYRILKLAGNEALVLAMQDYNVGTTYPYSATSKTTTFGSYTGQQYAGSDLDILLNTTMYGEMNSTAKSAIIAKNIDQNMFSYSGEPNTLEESEPYTYDYQYQFDWDDWDNSNLVGTVNVGSRYVYALDVADIYEYIGRRYISSSELNEMFFNQNTAYRTPTTMGFYYIWLRSATSLNSNYVWYVNGNDGATRIYFYSVNRGVRAAFVIDLSMMGFDI